MASEEGSMNPMDSIFHEKQEGSLCAQHCLNTLLQGHYFTAVDLAEIARELDTMERQQMAVAGENSEEYRLFLQQPSSNYDDSGFFSIQVIQKALKVWNIDLIPYTSTNEVAVSARRDPRSQKAYICNFRDHWFSIRNLGNQWFNLNSLLTYPELVSDTFLSLLLTQLQQEGYSIFVSVGLLPSCDADQILSVIPAVQTIKPPLLHESKDKSPGGSTNTSGQFVDSDIQRALQESKRLVEENDESLKRALALSMESMPQDFVFDMADMSAPSVSHPSAHPAEDNATSTPSAEELRLKRLAYYNKDTIESNHEGSASTPSVSGQTPKDNFDNSSIAELSEEDMLKMAVQMSMEG